MRHHFLGDDLVPGNLGPAAPANPGGSIVATPTVAKHSSPFSLHLPKATQALFDQIRAKAKQALPAAPVAVPTPAPAFKLGLLGWGLIGVGGYMLLFRKRGKKHG